MTSKPRVHRYAAVLWIAVALMLMVSSAVLSAQDAEEELTFEELRDQRELALEQIADAAATIDASTATIEELATAIDEVAALADLHQLRLDEAIDRYDSALGRLNQAEESHDEVLEEIGFLRVLVGDFALAQFTGESGRETVELALANDPGKSARLAHLFELQTGSAQDAKDRLSLLESQAGELVAERNAASSLAEESLAEMEHRSLELDATISQQEELLKSAELRLATGETDAEAAAILFEETEARLVNYVRGIGAPAPVDRADIVTISFYEGLEESPFFQIQVHKDIEEQTRGLYELAFSQDIDLGGWGYRDTERQIGLRRAHCGDTDYDIWLKPAGQCSPPTARPGYSKHEQGRAIDFQWNGGSIGPRSGIPFRWLAANAPQFGFVNLPSEPWHWSDGTANIFDPTVAVPDFPEDAVPEAEPDDGTIELLTEPLEGEVGVGEEVVVAVGVECAEPEAAVSDTTVSDTTVSDNDVSETAGAAECEPESEPAPESTETAPPEALASRDDDAEEPPVTEPTADKESADQASADADPDDADPADEGPADDEPANETPTDEDPIVEPRADEAPVEEQPVEKQSAEAQPEANETSEVEPKD